MMILEVKKKMGYGYKEGKELSAKELGKEVKTILENLENNPSGLGLKVEEIADRLEENNVRHLHCIELTAILNELIKENIILMSCVGVKPVNIVFWPMTHYKQEQD